MYSLLHEAVKLSKLSQDGALEVWEPCIISRVVDIRCCMTLSKWSTATYRESMMSTEGEPSLNSRKYVSTHKLYYARILMKGSSSPISWPQISCALASLSLILTKAYARLKLNMHQNLGFLQFDSTSWNNLTASSYCYL